MEHCEATDHLRSHLGVWRLHAISPLRSLLDAPDRIQRSIHRFEDPQNLIDPPRPDRPPAEQFTDDRISLAPGVILEGWAHTAAEEYDGFIGVISSVSYILDVPRPTGIAARWRARRRSVAGGSSVRRKRRSKRRSVMQGIPRAVAVA